MPLPYAANLEKLALITADKVVAGVNTEIGERATHVMVRPEHVRIANGDASGPNLFSGEIEKVIFSGKSVEYVLKTEFGEAFSVTAPSTEIRSAGDRVNLQLPPENCVLLSEHGAN